MLLPMAVGMNNVRNVMAALSADEVIVIEPSKVLGDSVDSEVSDYTDGIAAGLRRGLVEKFGEIPESTLLFELARGR